MRTKTIFAAALAACTTTLGTEPAAPAVARGSAERKVQASLVVTLAPPSPGLQETRTIDLFVPKRFYDAGSKLPHCNPSRLLEKRPEACPKGSIVGGGISYGYTILGGEFVRERLALTIFNGPHGSLLTWVEGHTPVAIEAMVPGTVTKPAGYGLELAFTIPSSLLEPLPGAPGWLQTLDAHLSGKAGWLRASSCPPSPWALEAQFGYTNGQSLTLQAQLACV